MNIGKTIFAQTMDFLSLYGISQMCKALQRQLQSKNVFLPRSISLYGVCSTYVSRKFARYRSMPSFYENQIVSHGNQESRALFLATLSPMPTNNATGIYIGFSFIKSSQQSLTY